VEMGTGTKVVTVQLSNSCTVLCYWQTDVHICRVDDLLCYIDITRSMYALY